MDGKRRDRREGGQKGASMYYVYVTVPTRNMKIMYYKHMLIKKIEKLSNASVF